MKKSNIVGPGDPSAGHWLGGERGQARPVKQGKAESHRLLFFSQNLRN
jgi:hypothetical protein